VSFGGSILLLVIGAILTFALNVKLGFLNLDIVGIVLMAAGALGLALTSWAYATKRRASRTAVEPDGGDVDPPDVA
jgi:hypothetical protein